MPRKMAASFRPQLSRFSIGITGGLPVKGKAVASSGQAAGEPRVHDTVSANVLGRVLSVDQAGSFAGIPAGVLFGGVLAGTLGIGLHHAVSGLGLLVNGAEYESA